MLTRAAAALPVSPGAAGPFSLVDTGSPLVAGIGPRFRPWPGELAPPGRAGSLVDTAGMVKPPAPEAACDTASARVLVRRLD